MGRLPHFCLLSTIQGVVCCDTGVDCCDLYFISGTFEAITAIVTLNKGCEGMSMQTDDTESGPSDPIFPTMHAELAKVSITWFT